GADLRVPVPDIARTRGPQTSFQAIQGQIRDDGGADAALWRPDVRRMEDVPFHVSRLQPLVQDGFVHGDVGQEPVVAELVNTRTEVARSHPSRRGLLGQYREAWCDGIARGARGPNPVGVRFRPRLGDGV